MSNQVLHLIRTPDFPNNTFGLGYWNISDPQHPDYQTPITINIPSHPASQTSYRTPIDSSSESKSSTASAGSFQTIHKPNSPVHPDPSLSIDTIIASLNTTVSLTGTLPLNPPDMSATSTTTTSANPPMNGLKGVAPAIFNSKPSQANNFLNEFHHYKLLTGRTTRSASLSTEFSLHFPTFVAPLSRTGLMPRI
jgi:hypothetical protein